MDNNVEQVEHTEHRGHGLMMFVMPGGHRH